MSPGMRSASTLGMALAGIGLFVYATTFLPPNTFPQIDISAFRTAAGKVPMSVRRQIATQLGADALTDTGVSGWVDYDSESGSLVLDIKNRNGNPVEGVNVSARFTRADGSVGPNVLLLPSPDKLYRAPVGVTGGRPMGVTITAVDPNAPGTGMLFRVEKEIPLQ